MLVVRLTDGRTDCRNFLEERGGEERGTESLVLSAIWRFPSLSSSTYFLFSPIQLLHAHYTSVIFAHAFLTFLPHAHLEALFEPAVLALVPVVLVHGTAAAAPALVGQVASDRPLEKGLATCTDIHNVTSNSRTLNARKLLPSHVYCP